MPITFLLTGMLIGFAMAAPLGPLGILCIRKTLTTGHLQGWIIGLGAATADMLYSSVAAFGLTAVADGLDSQRVLIRIIGGVLLLIIGIKTFRTKPKDPSISVTSNGIVKSYVYSLGLTLTNPTTIFSFIAVFATFGVADDITVFSSAALVLGIFLGSSLWFFILSSGVTLFRNRLSLKRLSWANRIAGILIVISGLLAVGTM